MKEARGHASSICKTVYTGGEVKGRLRGFWGKLVD